MKKTVFFVSVICVIVVLSVSTSFSGKKRTSLVQVGKIEGKIETCFSNDNSGIIVHIPGKSFMVKTGSDGKFEMFLVPLGVYDIVIELEGNYPRIINNVEVRGDIIQNLGTIIYCPKNDKDEDGYELSKDCNDEDSSINPGAEEVCDGKDNDCDDAVDEDLFRKCDTGIPGACSKGEQRCVKGRWYPCKQKIFPEAEELNSIDDDCDGVVDEGCR